MPSTDWVPGGPGTLPSLIEDRGSGEISPVGTVRTEIEDARKSRSVTPKLLAYAIAPAALLFILPLMHFGVIAHRPVWLWLGVFMAAPITSALVDHLYTRKASPLRLHARIAQNAAAVTTVIYLTGWGPVLVLAYAFLALENIARSGSRMWKPTAFWSLLGISIGQVLVWQDLVPSRLAIGNANVLALLGAFMLCFVIRMAGAVVAQKEVAERSMRLSEDRFRSLIQNSSDVTIVVDQEGLFTYVSPAITPLLGYEPGELMGTRATDLIHDDDVASVSESLMALFGRSTDAPVVQFRMVRKDASIINVEAVISDQIDRPSVGGYVANFRDITERKEIEDFLAYQAMHDSLTGLANRHLTIDRAGADVASIRAEPFPERPLLHRPGQFQGHQRLPRPRSRRLPAQGRGRAVHQHRSEQRHGRAYRWRRIRDTHRRPVPVAGAADHCRADPGSAARAVPA